MPKISAPTVKEHRDQVRTRLIDAAENLLRDRGADGLTAGAVSSAAGIARNSIYRYVDSVDDLRGLVMARHLPAWMAAVQVSVDAAKDPRERVVAWARANLEQAANSGHGYLMRITRGRPADATRQAVDDAHSRMGMAIYTAVAEIHPAGARVLGDVIYAMVDAGFRRLDAGDDADLVIATVTDAVRAVVT
ncbi:MAG: TetR/AcrR family transcriptional regulator [Propionibacteriaceae bacterium]|nr:TetR/AcrR family transcriptional regulator [Micropruina sp.]HBX81743.1 TetR family transcriptional regulator [Propionibacteriaceae bacterium]HBY23197.1 TetR family transcriptional regulator [Propionibacteriaceae bacterium]